MLSQEEIKRKVGIAAAQLVQDNSIIGIGSGSTAIQFIEALGERVREGLKCNGVPTSNECKEIAGNKGINLVELNDVAGIDLTIDGADEIDASLNAIKGGGGALLQEKMVAAASKQFVIIADHTKFVNRLGSFPLPLEVIPFGWKQVQRKIYLSHNRRSALRMKNAKPFITDHGHYILDCHFEEIDDPVILDQKLLSIPGVMDTGLFVNMAHSALIGFPDGSIRQIDRANKSL
jgi:ribose 5-phosphate isomerase A